MITRLVGIGAAAVVAACAGRTARGPFIEPLDSVPPIATQPASIAARSDSVHVTVTFAIRNPTADTLVVPTSCGTGFALERNTGQAWTSTSRPRTVVCLPAYSEIRLVPRDSALVQRTFDLGASESTPRDLPTLLTSEWRVTSRAARCMRHTRLDCWRQLASAPFAVLVDACPDSTARAAPTSPSADLTRTPMSRKEWYVHLSRELGFSHSIIGRGIDEAADRIMLTIDERHPEAVLGLDARLRELHVPCGLVRYGLAAMDRVAPGS